MPTAPRTHFPYPDEYSNPWADLFDSMVEAIDASLYAGREDRNIVVSGGGTMAFTASSGLLTWGADIDLLASFTGYLWRIAGPGSLTVTDGQMLYLTVTRAPQGVTTYTLTIGNITPNEPRGDDQLLLGYRRGSRIHFRDGFVLNDGESRVVFDSSGAGGGTSVPSAIIFRPGVPTVAPAYATWAEIQAVLALPTSLTPITIIVDDRNAAPVVAVGVTDCNQATLTSYNDLNSVALTLPDGAVLQNLQRVSGLTLDATAISGNSLQFTSTVSPLYLDDGAILNSDVTSTQPLCALATGQTLQLFMRNSARTDGNTSGKAIFDAASGATINATVLSKSRPGANCFTGAVGATLSLSYDSSSTVVNDAIFPFSGFLGTQTATRLANAYAIVYNDTLVNPPLGATTVQTAIDALKSTGQQPGDDGDAYLMGPNRPFLGNFVYVASQVLDTGLIDGVQPAGSDLVMADTRLCFVGKTGGVEAQLFSFEPGGFVLGQDVDMTLTQAGMKNPSALVGVGVYAQYFNVLSVSKAGAISSIIYETIFQGATSNWVISQPAGAEDWTGSRATYVYQSYAGSFSNGTFFWTAPLANKVYADSFYEAGLQTSLSLPGETPTGICADVAGNIWVSFTGSGKIRKYSVGQTNLTYFQLTQVFEVTLAGVIELLFDGKYVWALSTAGAFGTLYKLNSVGTLLGTHAFTNGSISSTSRMAFDGHAVWVTRGVKISSFYVEGPLVDLYNGDATDARGIVVDRVDGVVYYADYATGSLKVFAIFQARGSGSYPPVRQRTVTWRSGYTPMPATIPIANFPIISGMTSVAVEIDILATSIQLGGGVSAYWRKSAYVGTSAGNFVIVGSVSDVVPPKMDVVAVGEGWDVTFTDGTPVLNISVTQGTHSLGPVTWTATIRHTYGPYGGF